MLKNVLDIGRITPFIAASIWIVPVAWADPDPAGYWQFVDDSTGVEIAACADPKVGLCGRIVHLPKAASALPPAQQQQLCNLVMIGALKASAPKGRGELQRFDGWVIDPEERLKTAVPKRHAGSLVLTSEVGARLEVQGSLGIVVERHALMRTIVPGSRCE